MNVKGFALIEFIGLSVVALILFGILWLSFFAQDQPNAAATPTATYSPTPFSTPITEIIQELPPILRLSTSLEVPLLFPEFQWQPDVSENRFKGRLRCDDLDLTDTATCITGEYDQVNLEGTSFTVTISNIENREHGYDLQNQVSTYYLSQLESQGWYREYQEIAVGNLSFSTSSPDGPTSLNLGMIGITNDALRHVALSTRLNAPEWDETTQPICPCTFEAQLFVSDSTPLTKLTKSE